MRPPTALLFLLLAPPSLAVSVCTNFDIAVAIATQGFTFNVEPFANSSVSTQFVVQGTSRSADTSAAVGPTEVVNGTYHINARYCTPEEGSGNGNIQILTHGIGFDKSYWHFGGDDTNYVAAATAAGYATFSYDRLGVGQSDKPDPYFDVQAPTELAILAQLTNAIRTGALGDTVPTPNRTIHVGHSFGSVLSNGLAAAYPTLSDGVVLTGFSYAQEYLRDWQLSLNFRLASEVRPDQWGNLSSGYLTWGDKYQNQQAFLTYPYFDAESLDVAEQTKQPVTLGELLSIGQVQLTAETFTGPVQIITGDADVPFCGANCAGIVDDRDTATAMFPQASVIDLYIQPRTGHGLNLHHNASGAYQVIHAFLNDNGL